MIGDVIIDDVWKNLYEISPWNDRKLMNENAYV